MSQVQMDTLKLVDKDGVEHVISTTDIKADVAALQTGKQDTLTAGTNIEITAEGTINALGSGVSSVNTRTGNVVLTSADVSLANVDNTADADKPVSTAQEARIMQTVQLPVSGKVYNTGDTIVFEGAIYEANTDNTTWGGTITASWDQSAFSSNEVTAAINAAVGGIAVDLMKFKPDQYVYATLADAPTEGNTVGWVIVVTESSAEYVWGTDADGGEPKWIEFGSVEVVITENNLQATFNGETKTLAATLGDVKTYVDTQVATRQATLTAGANIEIVDNTISATAEPLTPATATTLGGVIVGEGVAVTADGTISAATFGVETVDTEVVGTITFK